jgi:hypothetical protein
MMTSISESVIRVHLTLPKNSIDMYNQQMGLQIEKLKNKLYKKCNCA